MRLSAILAFSGLLCLPAQAAITVQPWGHYDGRKIDLYTLTNRNGVSARITNFGATIVSIRAPDRAGIMGDVVQGFDSLSAYTDPNYNGHYGAVLGRYANRIKNETYVLNGVTYHRTEGPQYDRRVWTGRIVSGKETQLVLSLTDPEGSMGFPGTVQAIVTYTLTDANTLRIDYRATTDKPTIVNMTNHTYFNLAGKGTILDHLLTINADAITPGDAKNVPTGEVRRVAGTVFDFHKPMPIGRHIDDPDPLLKQQLGYGVNYQLNGKPGTLRMAARLDDPKSGRVMEEWTTQSDMQLYSGNYASPAVALAKGYGRRTGVALEAERAPNSPNIRAFYSPVVTPQKPLHEVTEFRFLVDKK
jgi:aldose 1-epimerase